MGAGLLSFAVAPILVRLASDTPPIALAFWRTVFAIAILAPFWIWSKVSQPGTGVLTKKNFLLLAIAGLSLGLHFTLWTASLGFTTVASASVLVTIHPILLIVAESAFFRVRFVSGIWTGVILASLGSILLGLSDAGQDAQASNPLLGDGLAFSAACVFVIYVMIGRKLRQQFSWLEYVSIVYFFAAVACLGAMVFTSTPFAISDTGFTIALLLAILPQITGHGAVNYVVKFISPTILSTTILAEPVLATLLAAFLFKEIPASLSIIAMSVIASGLILTWVVRFRNKEAVKSPA